MSEDGNSIVNVRNKKVEIAFCLIIVAVVVGYLIYNPNEIYERPTLEYQWEEPARVAITTEYATFEEALKEATDVVVAQYVESRPFGESLTEYEFVVTDRVLGNTADRIFIYEANDVSITVSGERHHSRYRPGEITFTAGTDYLLPLLSLDSVYSNTRDNGFRLIDNIIINLDEPSNSTMYNEPLNPHSRRLDFDSERLSRDRIISTVRRLTRRNSPAEDFIRSEDMVDIINGSPYVFIVEIGEARRLSGEGGGGADWRSTDIYYVILVESLKGNVSIDSELMNVMFIAGTVFSGERHIVAVERLEEGSSSFDFTSRNSLFSIDQLDEIMVLISGD
ncbi:MAG: hypothetical protein FWE31_06095 [Firmicutes bacterium]|nr:hypothetical protein [Bacillota bacterium]